MNLEKLIVLISNEFSIDAGEIDGDTLLEDIAGDEFEIQALAETIENEFEVTVDGEPQGDWTISDLLDAISE